MNIKNENGVTLLALVVTIVVMVILASIGISASIGDNGLIKQTQKGVIEASIREVEEAIDAYTVLEEKDELAGKIDISSVEVLELIDSPDLPYTATIIVTEDNNNELTTIDINRYDFNNDGVVNNIDVQYLEAEYIYCKVLKYQGTNVLDPNWEEVKKYDYNKNGSVYLEELMLALSRRISTPSYYDNGLPFCPVFDLNENGIIDEDDVNILKQQYYIYRITPEGLKEIEIKGNYGKGTENDAFYVKKYATEEMEVYYVDNDGVKYTVN